MAETAFVFPVVCLTIAVFPRLGYRRKDPSNIHHPGYFDPQKKHKKI